ncbi:MAG: S-layer homology domain-containing protein [Propioniciclava sp.]
MRQATCLTASLLGGLLLLTTVPPSAWAAPPVPVVSTEAVTLETAVTPDELPEEISASAPEEDVQAATADVEGEVGIVAVVAEGDTFPEETYYRTTTDGVASDWQPVEAEAATDPNPEAGTDTVSSEPIIVADADTVEVVTADPEAAPVQLLAYTSTVTNADAVTSQYAWQGPAILSRYAWRANESLVKYPYTTGLVTGAMIHHTAGSNSYSSSEVPAILRSIQAFHVKTRGWNDIAYNVLVDRFGRAWQGRGGRIEDPIAGGHAYGITNKRVFGIALMGTYDTIGPSSAQQEKLAQVIAWKLDKHGVNPHGSTWGSGGTDGGSTYLPAISGHRDERSTACPGAVTYSRMGKIRARVATLMDRVTFPLYHDLTWRMKFTNAMNYLKKKDYATTYPDRGYHPSETVTRGMVAGFFRRMAGSPEPAPGAMPFPDVTPDNPHYKDILWMSQQRITGGYSDGTYRPNNAVTRSAYATFLYRFAGGSPVRNAPTFTDVSASHPHRDAVGWFAANGISSGYSDGTFGARKSFKRSHLAAFIYRYRLVD